MRWKIADFEFLEQHQTLILEQNTLRLEPMVSELLAYFCRHQNQIISKDQLLDDVWHGRFVSDNAISKLITKLRKALNDDARNAKFIITVPKRGYRFIAPVTQLTEQPTKPAPAKQAAISHNQSTSPALKTSYNKPALLVMALFMVIVLSWFSLSTPPTPQVIISAKAITSDKGSEYFPNFAADGIHMAYMNHAGYKFKLYVKNIYSGEQVEVNHGPELGVGPGDWNDEGTKLVYLVATLQSCEYFIREFNGLEMSEPKLIHTCKTGSFGHIKFTHDDNLVIFSESAKIGQPYSLYSLEVDSGKTQWLPQPDLHLGGNSQFDLHPTENKLLISSPNEQQYEGFYQLDLDTQQLDLLFNQNAYICCGIWSHDGNHIVLMGEHPAHEIVQYDLDGSNKTLLFAGSQELTRPERHSNGNDYAFSALKRNLNVIQYHIDSNTTSSILNDTFNETLAVLSPNNKQIAYISLTSGNEELWLYERNSGKKKKVTQFADGRHYVDLVWSPNANKLAGLTLNAVHIIDITTGDAKKLPLPEKEIRGISFKSANTVAFSIKLESNWQVVEFNLKDNSMKRLEPKWQSVQYHQLAQNWLWADQDGNWYQGEHAEPLILPKQNLNVFYGRQFNVKKSGQHIGFYDWQKESIIIYDIASNQPITQLNTQVGHFSINGDVVLISKPASEITESDIYQTYSVSSN